MAEFPDLDPNEEHTPESLELKLREYSEAIRTEFELAQSQSVTAEENAEKFSVDFAKQNLGNALAQIAWLSQNSTSDSVRLNASKFLTELAREDARNDGDPIKGLLDKLAGNKATSSSSEMAEQVVRGITPDEDE
jgi:hypothetical protein